MFIKPIGNIALHVGGKTFDADEVGALISVLADERAKLLPPVIEEYADGHPAPHPLTAFVVKPLTHETVLVAFRHRGIGWCPFVLTAQQAELLRHDLAAALPGASG